MPSKSNINLKSSLQKFEVWGVWMFRPMNAALDFDAPPSVRFLMVLSLFAPSLFFWWVLPRPWDMIVALALCGAPLLARALHVIRRDRGHQIQAARPEERGGLEGDRDNLTLESALALFDLPQGATKEQIDRAYRQVAKDLHTDRNPGITPGAARVLADKFIEAGRARDLLLSQLPSDS